MRKSKMRDFETISNQQVLDLFRDTIHNYRKVRIDDDLDEQITQALTIILDTIGEINSMTEFASRINGYDFDEIDIPESFAWLVQPASVRYIASRKFRDLRFRGGFFCNNEESNFTLDQWNMAWQILGNIVKVDFTPGNNTKRISDLRIPITVSESNFHRLVLSDEHAAPGFDDTADAILVDELPFVCAFCGTAFDDTWVRTRVNHAFKQFAQKSRS